MSLDALRDGDESEQKTVYSFSLTKLNEIVLWCCWLGYIMDRMRLKIAIVRLLGRVTEAYISQNCFPHEFQYIFSRLNYQFLTRESETHPKSNYWSKHCMPRC